MISLRFACGHAMRGDDRMTQAQCSHCGETRVSRVMAPAPRFVGIVTGPCAEFKELPAQPVRLTKEP
jgi:hypothetical protein